jgi:hypothetical protein
MCKVVCGSFLGAGAQLPLLRYQGVDELGLGLVVYAVKAAASLPHSKVADWEIGVPGGQAEI